MRGFAPTETLPPPATLKDSDRGYDVLLAQRQGWPDGAVPISVVYGAKLTAHLPPTFAGAAMGLAGWSIDGTDGGTITNSTSSMALAIKT
jgi:hypothetical protein